MADEERIEVPQSFLKLERMRARHIRYFAQRRELGDRIRDLQNDILHLERRNAALRPEVGKSFGPSAPGTMYPSDQIARNNRALAVIRAMLQVAEEERASCEDLAGDARLYESMRKHVEGEFAAWGIE